MYFYLILQYYKEISTEDPCARQSNVTPYGSLCCNIVPPYALDAMLQGQNSCIILLLAEHAMLFVSYGLRINL